MKRLLLFLSTILTIIAAQAQTLKTGDIVSISFKYYPWGQTLDYYTYMEASTSGILSKTYATDDCLWELGVITNGSTHQYTFKDLTTGKYLAVNKTGSNQEALKLSEKGAEGTLFSFTEKGGVEGQYMLGELYYTTVTSWGQAMPLLVSEYGGTFMVANWNAYDLYIEKWEQKGAGKPTGHFAPSKIEFSYIGDQEEDLETDDDPRPVQFMIEATTESYYKCIRRPDEALLRRTTNDVTGGDVHILGVYWESDSINKGTVSKLDVSKYINCSEPDGRAIMSLSQPTTAQDGKWQFTITPEGRCPMGLKQTIYEETVGDATVGIDRWVDYADNVVVEFQYGNSESQKTKMRVVRKSYREEELPALTFSINPLTYTFAPMMESKVFDVVAKHQHGKVIYNVDNQAIVTTYETGFEPKQVDLAQASYLDFSFSGDGASWLEVSTYSSNQILVKTKDANDGQNATKRSSDLTVKIKPQNHADHDPMSVLIPLHQRAVEIEGGIRFIPNKGVGNTSFEKNPYTDDDQQQVHTVEKTIYYTPNQEEIELRLQESGYSGYMRWYDYETGGDPYYNYTHDMSTTSWVRSPRGNNNAAFSAINTPRQGATEEEMRTIIENEGHSHGLYTLNKADGGALDEDNPYNPNPIIKPWADGAYHIMACDVSAYTDYEVKKDQYGQITSITEPTLSYRQIFHLRPAQEMADTLKARSERGVYLEEYKYQAPAGKQILLATEYRYKKARSHSSEMCYFFKDVWGTVRSITSSDPVEWYVETKNADGSWSTPQSYNATYSAEMDYLIVRNETYTYPSTFRYSLKLPLSSGHLHTATYTTDLLIARFEVEFVDIEKQGPTPQTIITQQRINSQYKTLTDPITFDNITTHLPWEQASYGYVYDEKTELGKTAADGTTKYKRGASQGCFPFYGEYTVLASVNKGWAQATAHGGTGKSLYVDGTMEPGLVASIEANATICTGQTMYCSAWFCNPTPSGWSGEGNPIFRCNIQGRNKNENGTYTPWEDAGVYFVGELLKGTGWQQVVFPIESAHSYDQTRVSIYNFATTNQGNDFMVDDINLYVSQLPIAAYQGKMACRSTGDATTSAAAVLRLDYSNINAGSNGYMYYQIYNESFESNANSNDPDTIGGYPVTLKENAAYYHDYDEDHNIGNHNHPYGSIHIPNANFNPEHYNDSLLSLNPEQTDTLLIYKSVSKLLDEMAANKTKHAKAYVKTENSGVVKWLLYVAHLIDNVTETQVSQNHELSLEKLYDKHKYSMRMAYTPTELDIPACNLQTPLHATQQTVFHLRNSDGKKIKHQKVNGTLVATKSGDDLVENIFNVSTNNCANDLYFLTSKIINNLAPEEGGSISSVEAPIYADWLVGEDFDDVYNNGRPATGSEEKTNADAAFKAKYGYTRGQIASAVMYDMRRIPTDDEPNPNYTARSLKELQPSAFESYQNYEIVKHLCDSGWLQLYDTTVYFYLEPDAAARYWCFPIEGTAQTKINNTTYTLKDCNEPKWVSISSMLSDYYLNIAPIAQAQKTAQQKMQIPTLKVLLNEQNTIDQITIPINERRNNTTVLGESDNSIKLELNSLGTNGDFYNLEAGKTETSKPSSFTPGSEYTIRLSLKHNNSSHVDGTSSCLIGYVFATIQVVPDTLVWTPDGTTFTGWGLDDNWKGWTDKNKDGKIDTTNELINGFVPISGANVIIPKLDNILAYPYIVPDDDAQHKHNHYPMTIDFEPYHCNNIYFESGARIHNQHLLQYNNAFVDMQVTAGAWNMVSAPLQGMVSGDMFIPHNGWWSSASNNLIAESNPFEVSSFQGIRSGDAAYAFWQAFYNTTVNKMTNNGLVDVTAGAEFVQSNTLIQELNPGAGYQLYGLGWEDKEPLTIRLPKPDTKYYYYNGKGGAYGDPVQIPTANRNKLAFTPTNNATDAMDITLTNKTPSQYFLFGNPTMAYINMHDFLHDNEGEENNKILNHVFYRIENGAWDATTEHTMGNDRFLAPMTSVMLEASTACTALQLTLKASHLTLNNQVSPFSEDNPAVQQAPRRAPSADEPAPTSELLTIYALTKNATARTVLATNPVANDYYLSGEDALFISTGVENESYVTTPLNMYTVAERVPMMADVRQGISNIPLAILAADKARQEYMQLAFYYTSNWSRTCYFCDSKTGQKIRIMDGLVISVEMPQNHEQRYFIEGPDTYLGSGNTNGNGTSTSVHNTNATSASIHAYSLDKGQLTVTANQPIRELKVYSITGQLLCHPISTTSCQLSTVNCQIPSGVCIVEATLYNGTTLHTQAVVK